MGSANTTSRRENGMCSRSKQARSAYCGGRISTYIIVLLPNIACEKKKRCIIHLTSSSFKNKTQAVTGLLCVQVNTASHVPLPLGLFFSNREGCLLTFYSEKTSWVRAVASAPRTEQIVPQDASIQTILNDRFVGPSLRPSSQRSL